MVDCDLVTAFVVKQNIDDDVIIISKERVMLMSVLRTIWRGS